MTMKEATIVEILETEGTNEMKIMEGELYEFEVNVFLEMLKNDKIREALKKLIEEAIVDYEYSKSPDRQED